ncbi:magnesium transporter [Reinekea marinisedimentorum]|uniref:Magnesium transporter MgtE n=1 Tax=Reinekea marinisedimentorum TaxID=230495 RepID=A0A4R3IA09_9GAMM|nr:magnesium transporter [Reinekea marinisedimentorum]TCS43258.1 magnesium transporter [Reinekea marinisedimentorum]
MADDLSSLINEVTDATLPDQEILIGKMLVQRDFEDVALLLESLPLEQRLETWNSIPVDKRIDVLVVMRRDPRESLLEEMSLNDLDALFENIEPDELVELSESLPTRIVARALQAMDSKQQKFFEVTQQYADEHAGRWINQGFLTLPQNAKVRDALRLLRRDIAKYIDAVFLVDRLGHFIAAVRVSAVIGAPDHVPLSDLDEDDFATITAEDDAFDSALKVQKSGFSALPVINAKGVLIGRLDIGTASEIVNEDYERKMMASAGMDEDEDLFSPVISSAKNRAVWLGINLLTAFAASWFIGLFEATLQQVVTLAVLMPIVASMGGIAGSQTLTLVIRGLALGQVSTANRKALLSKEVRVGGLNGVIWALVIGIVVAFWFSSPLIGLVISLAILMNIVSAAFVGVLIPVALDKLKLDPALSGSVILTTVTDIVGFVAFLGLGALILT